jgi:hypothetical protein
VHIGVRVVQTHPFTQQIAGCARLHAADPRNSDELTEPCPRRRAALAERGGASA